MPHKSKAGNLRLAAGMKKASGLAPAGSMRKKPRKKRAAGMRVAGSVKRRAAGMRVAGSVKKRAGGMRVAGSMKRKTKKAGGYVPGKILADLTLGRLIRALKAHWRK